jgi:hypothetical protein
MRDRNKRRKGVKYDRIVNAGWVLRKKDEINERNRLIKGSKEERQDWREDRKKGSKA